MNTPILMTLNLRDDTILLGEGVLNALDRPRHVQLLLNKDEKMLLLRACAIEEQQALVVPEGGVSLCEISGRSLLRKIRKMVGWEDSQPRVCAGEYLPIAQAVRFSLADAQIIDAEPQ